MEPAILYYITPLLTICANVLGIGIGQGRIASAAIEAINIAPHAKSSILRATIFALALTETTAVIAFLIAVTMIMSQQPLLITQATALGQFGIFCAMGIPGLVIGIACALPCRAACFAIARQPFFSQKISNLMLITTTLIQTPAIFGFIFAFLIFSQALTIHSYAESIRLLAAGACIGIGSIGPAIGSALFAQQACAAPGINRKAYSRIVSFTFLSQGMIETPVIFSAIISFILIANIQTAPLTELITSVALASAALCTGISTLMPGISSGKVAAEACKQITQRPENYSTLSRLSMLAQGFLDTFVMYAFLVSLLLIFFQS